MNKTMDIPAMSPPEVHNYLREVGKSWQGKGIAIELGCWLGATSVPLLQGLAHAGYDKLFWGFDAWTANAQQVQMTQGTEHALKLNENVHPHYLLNVLKVYEKVFTKKGMIPGVLDVLGDDPIEICILDAPKKNPVFIETIRRLHELWIPGVTILGLLDYFFYEKKEGKAREVLLAPVDFIESNRECFTTLEEFRPACPAFFRYEKPLINI